MENEIWKAIEGYEGLYQVSNLGRVRSLSKKDSRGSLRRERILRLGICANGYGKFTLYKNGVGKQYKAHRLVASMFIPNPDNLPQINHKNENKTDNRVENLEWCDYGYNTNYGTRNERAANKNSIPIRQLDMNGEFIREWKSASEVERVLGISHSNITAHIRQTPHYVNGNVRYLHSVGGFLWEYANLK